MQLWLCCAMARHPQAASSVLGLHPVTICACTLSLKYCHSLAAGRYLKLAGPWCLGQPPRFWQRAAPARPTCAQGACCGGSNIAGSFYTVTVSHRGTHRPSMLLLTLQGWTADGTSANVVV